MGSFNASISPCIPFKALEAYSFSIMTLPSSSTLVTSNIDFITGQFYKIGWIGSTHSTLILSTRVSCFWMTPFKLSKTLSAMFFNLLLFLLLVVETEFSFSSSGLDRRWKTMAPAYLRTIEALVMSMFDVAFTDVLKESVSIFLWVY